MSDIREDIPSLSASEQLFHVSLSCEVKFVSRHQQQISYWHACSRPLALPAPRAALTCVDGVLNIKPLHGSEREGIQRRKGCREHRSWSRSDRKRRLRARMQ